MVTTSALDRLMIRLGSHRWRARACSWLGVALLAFNLVAGFGLRAAPLPMGEQVICTAGGIVVLHDDGEDASTARSGDGFCVFCLPIMHGGPIQDAGLLPGRARPSAVVAPLGGHVAAAPAAHPDFVAVPRAPPAV